MGQKAAAEGGELARRGTADAAEAHDAAGEFGEAPQLRAGGNPAAGAHFAVHADDAASPGEREADCMVRDLLHAVVGHVGDPDAARGGGVDGDVVQPDAEAGHDLQRFRGLDGGGRNLGPASQDGGRLAFAGERLDLGGRRGIGRPGDQAHARAFDDAALDAVVGPGVVGEKDGVCHDV